MAPVLELSQNEWEMMGLREKAYFYVRNLVVGVFQAGVIVFIVYWLDSSLEKDTATVIFWVSAWALVTYKNAQHQKAVEESKSRMRDFEYRKVLEDLGLKRR